MDYRHSYEKLMTFEKWVNDSEHSDLTVVGEFDKVVNDSDKKMTYGTHLIMIENPTNGKRVKVKAKFDTGASASSIDFVVARKLGFSGGTLAGGRQIEEVIIPSSATQEEQDRISAEWKKKLANEHSDITDVQVIRSASGFSLRAYVKVTMIYAGQKIPTVVNIKNREGMSAPVLVGLDDMI